MNNYVIGIDLAKENSDNTCVCFQFVNSCLEEMKELWKIGDEYPLPEFNKKRLGLHKESKLIVSSIYENNNQEVFMNMLVR
ncbi:MAG TPA: hypothetical protein VIM42_08460 [Clostridium sp.]